MFNGHLLLFERNYRTIIYIIEKNYLAIMFILSRLTLYSDRRIYLVLLLLPLLLLLLLLLFIAYLQGIYNYVLKQTLCLGYANL